MARTASALCATPRRAPGRQRANTRPAGGFTLIEMMVAVSVLLILAVVAGATFSTTISGYRISGAANSLSRDLQYARAEAAKRGQPVSVCASTDGANCSGSSTWTSGWIVFYDANGNGAVDTGDTVLRAETQSPGTSSFVADNSVSSVTFNRLGSAAALPANPVTFRMHDPTSNRTLTRCVALSPSGRSLVQNYGTGACT